MMKKEKNCFKLFISFAFLFLMLTVFPVKSEAADGYSCSYVGTYRQKVGKYYYWMDKTGENYKFYCSTGSKGKGKLLLTAKNTCRGWLQILTDNKTVYLIEPGAADSCNIYSVKPNGSGKKKLGKIKGSDMEFVNFYGKNLYFGNTKGTWMLSLKTNKLKKISARRFWDDPDQTTMGQRWIYNIEITGSYDGYDGGEAWLLDCKEGKAIRLSKACLCLEVSGDKIYYGEKNYLYCYFLTKKTKSRITLYKYKGRGYIVFTEIQLPYVFFEAYDYGAEEEVVEYQYNIKTKKLKKISSES